MINPTSIKSLGVILLLVVNVATAEQEHQAVMRFHNDDLISGKLKALGENSLLWESDILAEPATFDLDHVLDLTLNAENKAPESSHVAMLTLKNGDQVHGQLGGIDEDHIDLNTWFAGPMQFGRSMVSSIDIQGGGSLHYRGPKNIDGWIQQPEQSWEYKRQSFISRKAGSIAREKLLPEQFSISFTVERKSDQLDLKLMLFSTDVDNSYPRSGYELSFQRSSIYLRSGKTRNFLGSDHSRELSQNDKALIEVRASSKTGKVVLLINGKVAEVWSDPGVESNDFGTGLHFIAGSNQVIRISNIKIAPWDGRIEHLPQPRGMRIQRGNAEPQPKPDDKAEEETGRMKLANGDSLEGEVSSVDEGLITLKTPLGEIKLPIERLRSLNLEGLGTSEAKRESRDIRAYFADGSILVFRLDQVDGNRIVGSSQHFSTQSRFGSADFKLSAINRIEFDIYNEKLDALRSSRDW